MLSYPQTLALIDFCSILQLHHKADYGNYSIPALEHIAIHEQDVNNPNETFLFQGYTEKLRYGGVSFYGKKDSITIEVVPNTTPRHVGFVFHNKIENFFSTAGSLSASSLWTQTNTSRDGDVDRWFMYRHKPTGYCFQIVYREDRLFTWDS